MLMMTQINVAFINGQDAKTPSGAVPSLKPKVLQDYSGLYVIIVSIWDVDVMLLH